VKSPPSHTRPLRKAEHGFGHPTVAERGLDRTIKRLSRGALFGLGAQEARDERFVQDGPRLSEALDVNLETLTLDPANVVIAFAVDQRREFQQLVSPLHGFEHSALGHGRAFPGPF
jgi:hypothetical protein